MYLENLLLYSVTYFGLFTSIFFLLTVLDNRNNFKNPKLEKHLSVTIAVPAFNEEKTILKTIDSLLGLDYPKDKLRIIVVDDGSTDSTYSFAKSIRDPRLSVLRKRNGGKGSALNYALRHTSTELFGSLDADSFVEPQALNKMVGFFSEPVIMAVTPSLRVYQPESILQKIQYVEYLIGIFLRKVFAFLGSIHVTPGPFSIYRTSFFEKYGGYDENNLTEDIEVALRIQEQNYQIENSVDASVFTIAPKTFSVLFRQRMRWYVGFTRNILNYKHLLSPKYGNLGILILPCSFVSIFLIITVLFYTFYKLVIVTAMQNLKNYYSINFDLLRIFSFNFDTFFVNTNPLALLTLLSLIIGIFVVFLAKRMAKDKTRIKIHYLYYLFLYWMLFGFWWVVSLFFVISKKKLAWGRKEDA